MRETTSILLQERWHARLEEAEAAARAKLGRERALVAQFEGTIAELSQDVRELTAQLQANAPPGTMRSSSQILLHMHALWRQSHRDSTLLHLALSGNAYVA